MERYCLETRQSAGLWKALRSQYLQFHIEREHVCIHSLQDAKLSLKSAYAKLGHSRTIFCVYMTIELCHLILNLCVVIRTGPFLHHAVDIHSLCEYYDLYGGRRQFVERTFVETSKYGDSWKETFSKETFGELN